jgi:anti-sigma B factor antagonist
MNVTVEHEGDVAVVRVEGDLDASGAPNLKDELEALLAAGQRDFVIDLAQVHFMDSAGIATLVQLFKRVRTGDGDVRLAGVQPQVEKIFRLVRLDRIFKVYPACDGAVASFRMTV